MSLGSTNAMGAGGLFGETTPQASVVLGRSLASAFSKNPDNSGGRATWS